MVFRSIKSFKRTVKKMRERFPEFNELGFTDEECFAFGCLIKYKTKKVTYR